MVRKVVIFGGFSAGEAEALPIQMTPLSRAFAPVPGLSVLLDPVYRTASGDAFNLAQAESIAANVAPNGGALTGSFPNDAPGFEMTDQRNGQFLSPVDLNLNSWSVMVATRLDARSGGAHGILGPVGDGDNGPSLPRLSITRSSGAAMASNEHENSVTAGRFLIYTPEPSLIGRTAVSLWTCSNGIMRYFLDGVQCAEEPAPDFNRKHRAGEFCFFRYSRGLGGNLALFSSDLSQSDMTDHRQRIERFLMQKYGIA